MTSERVRGVASTCLFGGATLWMAPRAQAGMMVALIAFALGAAFMFFAQYRVGPAAPNAPARTWAAAIGVALVPIIVTASNALGLTELPPLLMAMTGGVLTGILLIYTLRLWPELRGR